MASVPVMITMPAGKTLVLSAGDTETVAQLKRRALRQGMPRLCLWRGEGDCYMRTNTKPLRDAALVRDCAAAAGVRGSRGGGGGSSVCLQTHLVVRQRGGCWMISLSILFTLALAAAATPFTCGTSLLIFPFLIPLLFILPWFCL